MDNFKIEYLVILKKQGAFCSQIKTLNRIRNQIIHESNLSYGEGELRDLINQVDDLAYRINNLRSEGENSKRD
jgi:hypothetical protein